MLEDSYIIYLRSIKISVSGLYAGWDPDSNGPEDPDPEGEFGSGSRQAKVVPKKGKN
jgi:hypothetical protein